MWPTWRRIASSLPPRATDSADRSSGIQEQEIESPRSLGFLGLRERVLDFGGAIDVKGQEGKGTTVSVSIPLQVHKQPVFHE